MRIFKPTVLDYNCMTFCSPTVLVTGSSGMIGTALVKRLLTEGVNVRGFDRRPNRWSDDVADVTVRGDLLDPDVDLPEADIVVHLAAHSRVRDLVEEPRGAEENVQTVITVLNHARQTDADLIFTSSREVYGDQGLTIYDETDVGPRDAVNPYGASKTGAEAMIAAYSRCYDIRACTLRLSNIYGRYDSYNRVIPTFIALASRGEDITVFGDNKVLDFLYIDDCVDALVRAIERIDAVQGEALNIGVGRGNSLRRLAELIVERVGCSVDISVEQSRDGEVDRFVSDIDRATRLLGFDPDYSLSEGIDETVSWYFEHNELLEELS